MKRLTSSHLSGCKRKRWTMITVAMPTYKCKYNQFSHKITWGYNTTTCNKIVHSSCASCHNISQYTCSLLHICDQQKMLHCVSMGPSQGITHTVVNSTFIMQITKVMNISLDKREGETTCPWIHLWVQWHTHTMNHAWQCGSNIVMWGGTIFSSTKVVCPHHQKVELPNTG